MYGTTVRLEALGGARLIGSTVTLDPLERKAAGLLTYLALEGPTHRSRLAALLWPEARAATARNNLVQLLRKLRLHLGFDLAQGGEALALTGAVTSDLIEARTRFAQGRLEDFLAHAGEPLAGLDFDDCPEFEDWLLAERDRWTTWRTGALRGLADQAEETGDLSRALALSERLLAQSEVSEDAWRRLMRLHHALGNRHRALEVWQRCQRVLRDELDVEPLPETHELARQIRSGAEARRSAPAVRAPLPLHVLRPPQLIGREREWAILQAARHNGRTPVITGAAGVGKTRLALDFAEAHGRYLKFEGRPGDAAIPYASCARGIRQLLATYPNLSLEAWVRFELSRLLPELSEAGGPPGLLTGEDAKLRLFEAAAWLVRAAAQAPGTRLETLVIEDLQFFDEASSELGHYLLSRLHPLPALLTCRESEAPQTIRTLLGSLIGEGRALRVRLEALTNPAVAALLGDLGVPPQLRGTLERLSGGNPLFLLETVRHLLQRGSLEEADPGNLELPERVKQLILGRLRRLSPTALQAARAAAVLRADFDLEQISGVLGASLLELASAWEELEAAQVVAGERFSHDLLLEAVLESLPPSVGRVLHRSAAKLLEERQAPAARIARHLLAGEQPAAAAVFLRRAAAEARARLRLLEAAEAARQAARLLSRLGQAEEAFDADAEALQLLIVWEATARIEALAEELSRDARTPAQRALVAYARAFFHIHSGQVPQADLAVRRGLALAGESGHPRLRMWLESAAGHVAFLQENHEASASAFARSLELSDQVGTAADRSSALANLAAAQAECERWEACIRSNREVLPLLVRDEDLFTRMQVLINLGLALAHSGRTRAALRAFEEAERLTLRFEAPELDRRRVQMFQAMAHLDLGDPGRALQHAEHARALGEAADVLRETARVLLRLGRPDLAEAHLEQALRLPSAALFTEGTLWLVLAQVRRAAGRQPWEELGHAAERMERSGRAAGRARVAVLEAALLPPAAALERARAALALCERHGMEGVRIDAHARAAQALMRLNEPRAALEHAERAQSGLELFTPKDLDTFEVRWVHAEACRANSRPEAAALLSQLHSDLLRTAEQRVPAEFRRDFLIRAPGHRDILEAAGSVV
ncbi:DNA-binding SARP family transcriptional activator [Deinobacterium chartae]|uniref:DNA-binding SARP family transcriptional activator n=1 Tax=Deinobacterium chartae TaxID=521158 RepID=A0A841I3C2_9DEIO|nr:BTAD domain-containing putative transcriptional regulator [Deinobacterium chartae]MBB6098415.1 DNA-binding SARP family transcriptional activator [Deinobacterium chartae]